MAQSPSLPDSGQPSRPKAASSKVTPAFAQDSYAASSSSTGAGVELKGPPPAIDGKDPVKAMRLKPENPLVSRLSVKVIGGLVVIASLGVGTALVLALQPRNKPVDDPELYSAAGNAKADGLSGLPQDYTGNFANTPKLGPPLPGDLARPILNAQRKAKSAASLPDETGTSDTKLTEAEQRRLQEQEAARLAQLFVPTNSRPISTSNLAGLPSSNSLGTNYDLQGLAPSASPQASPQTSQERQVAFLSQPSDQQTTSSHRITSPSSPYLLQAGSIIPAALITGIRSDLPGQITAQVTENVHDSPTGRILLIPQGSRLIGQYDNGIGFGQSRILLVWNRLILPNGQSITLDRQPGADAQGQAGLEDHVDYHWRQMFNAAALSTLLAVGAQAGQAESDSEIVRALRQGASDSISDIGQQIVQRQLNVSPTLTIRPGHPVRVILTRDLVLEPPTTHLKGN